MNFGIFDIEDTTSGDQAAPTVIKVVGVGGAGGNAVNRMIASGLKKVSFLALNTDVQALQRSNAQTRIAIGKELTGGLGAGGVPDVGEKAAVESKEEIKAELENTDMVFITAGMGGGTGTGAAAVVAEIAKSCNALTVAVVTTPFAFEGKKKMILAQQGIERLRKQVDTLILIPNQYLLKVVENNTPIKQAFLIADDVLYQGVQGISELITEPGEINIDFADVKTVMKGKGDALMGIGFGEGSNRAIDAAKEAISNPLLENASIDGAKSVLVNLAGSDNLTLQEYQDVVEFITANCPEDALIIAGQAYNPELGDRIKVTVVATGFERTEVTGAEMDAESVRRRFTQTERESTPASSAFSPSFQTQTRQNVAQTRESQPVQEEKKAAPQPQEAEAITVNRWQDLQQQLGKRAPSNDYSVPAVLRYQRGEDDENK
jgi:cell division protein FtsZ